MSIFSKKTGEIGENEAAKFLKKLGYKILKRNLNLKIGEIDILAEDKKEKSDIVVVEVKTKSSKDFGQGYEMVNYFKKKKLLSLAKLLQIKYPDKTIRIDIISIEKIEDKITINHYINAVQDETSYN